MDALAETDDITHVFLVTDSEEAYAEMRERVGAGLQDAHALPRLPAPLPHRQAVRACVKLTLKDFQETPSRSSTKQRAARAATRGRETRAAQALVLASPTGSGKTVIATA